MHKKNNKGFTLIEVLVVIAIIGILAVVAITSITKSIDKAKVAEFELEVRAIKDAVLNEYIDNKNTDYIRFVIYGDETAYGGKKDIKETLGIDGFQNILNSPEIILSGSLDGKKSLDLVIYFDQPKVPNESIKKEILKVFPKARYISNDMVDELIITLT